MVHVLSCLTSFAIVFVRAIHAVVELRFNHSSCYTVSHCTNIPQFITCNVETDIWVISRLGLLAMLLRTSRKSFGEFVCSFLLHIVGVHLPGQRECHVQLKKILLNVCPSSISIHTPASSLYKGPVALQPHQSWCCLFHVSLYPGIWQCPAGYFK